MPIEIRELIIKATIVNQQNDQDDPRTKKLAELLKNIETANEKNNFLFVKKIKLRESKINAIEKKLKRQANELIKLVKEIDKLKH